MIDILCCYCCQISVGYGKGDLRIERLRHRQNFLPLDRMVRLWPVRNSVHRFNDNMKPTKPTKPHKTKNYLGHFYDCSIFCIFFQMHFVYLLGSHPLMPQRPGLHWSIVSFHPPAFSFVSLNAQVQHDLRCRHSVAQSNSASSCPGEAAPSLCRCIILYDRFVPWRWL